MGVVVWTYGAYLVVSASLMAWVARTLFKNGRVFLVDVLRGDERSPIKSTGCSWRASTSSTWGTSAWRCEWVTS